MIDSRLNLTTEEKEALVSLMSNNQAKKSKKNPEFKALSLSFEKKLIDEFILYEIILPQYPLVASQLPENIINSTKDYVINVRCNLD